MALDTAKLDVALVKADALGARMDAFARRADAEFKEGDHPRDEGGRFGWGGGSTKPGVKHGEWEAPKKHKDGAETHRFPVQLRNGKTGYHEVYKTPSGESIVTMSHGYSRKVPSFEEAKKFVESHHN